MATAVGHLSSGDVTDDEFRIWFGGRLLAARKKRGLSQGVFARRLPPPIESRTVRGWEKGDVFPEVRNIVAILAALEMSPDEFFCD